MVKTVKKFKGGSLSSTNLIEKDGELFVRKTVSLLENREYGFQRWYSQLKKMQRYSIMFPGLFPMIIDYGMDGDTAYFDMEFYENAVNAQEYVESCTSQSGIEKFFNSLIQSIDILHKKKMKSSQNSIELYMREEVSQRLNDCRTDDIFVSFLENETIIFNGNKVRSFYSLVEQYKAMAKEHYAESYEVFTHGNMTLENILYVPQDDKVIFIDPYEENIIDSELAEYSQLLQSSNSQYEMYNSTNVITVQGNSIHAKINKSFGMECFNTLLLEYIESKFSYDQRISIRLFEISQFIRMLPFKKAVDKGKMILFYGLASSLLDRIRSEVKNGAK